ncbi:MAG: hypothetical protein M0Z59_02960 [Nitrospiraceae bacterium]|nr:hypothetical protein [Nitrospiraceae bacterium]
MALSGLYWTVPAPQGSLTISGDGRTATLQMKDVPVIDQPHWPKFNAPFTPARMSFRLVWNATDEKIAYDDPQMQFRVTGYKATAQLEASIEVPLFDFSWKSDPLETSKADFAIIGDEVNGKYYTEKPL